LLVSIASYRVLESEFQFAPKAAAGHSVGEYGAVVAAGSMPFAKAMQAVRARGQAMQSAVPVGVGGMTAVMGLNENQVSEVCKWAQKESGDGPVEPANLNAPGQIVVSGKKSVLDYLSANFKSEQFNNARAKFIPLKVSAPFHCSMMKPAEEKMRLVLKEVNFDTAKYPVVQNFSARSTLAGEELREGLLKQICAPVRWIQCVEKIIEMGATQSIEVGCGRVLNGLVKKIGGVKLNCLSLNSLDDLRAIESAFKGGTT
jgi:[acyl-carrier-protein] S-malonyltransferase